MSVDTARILLIEDDPAHAELINRAFEEEATEYELTTLTNLTQARQFLAEHTPHLVITDYVLPDGRGDEILEWAHGAFPVIVMTAQGSEQAAVELMKAGVLDYVVKSPAAFSGMRHTAKRALREWQHVIERQRAEEALRQNEERFRQIISSISDHIYVTRLTHNGEMLNLYLSPHLEALTGYPIEKMMTDWSFWQSTLIHPNDKAAAVSQNKRLKRGENSEIEYRIVRANGDLIWVRDSARVQSLDNGERLIYGVVSDITERKRSEEALYLDQVRREVLLQLNQLAEASTGEIMSTALEDFTRITESPIGYMAFVNPDETVMTMRAWSESALEECRVLETPIEYTLETAGLWGEAVRQRRPIITNDYQAPNPSKRGYPEGHVEVIRHMNIPVFEGNHIVMVVGVGNKPTCYTETDVQQLQLLSAGLWQIIQRKRAEQEREELLVQLKEQANQVQQLMNTVPEGVLLLDSRKCITLANPLGEEYLLTLADSRVGDTLTHLGDHPLVDFLTSPPQGLWHTAVVNTCHFEVISRPIESSTLNQHWVLVIRDVTQQREIEHRAQQQERLAAVGQLAAGIAHDFNNILAVITLYAKMSLRASDLPAKLQERLEIIDQQAWRASSLVQQILDFSRRAVLERSPLDLRAFLEEQVKLLERTLPEHIALTFFCDPETYIVNADPTRLQQAFMNLATNARDAMPNGGELHISLKHLHLDEHAHPTARTSPRTHAG
jgi:PAS domain S-box-containing protein